MMTQIAVFALVILVIATVLSIIGLTSSKYEV
jgi:hypothetical protein